MSRASGKELVRAVEAEMDNSHDTLYCNSRQYSRMCDFIAGDVMLGRTEDLKLFGLDVIEFDRIPTPIVCEKGQVFDLAKDWKDD